ncbi:MAG: Coenzyme F420 hydrogenase/dehydrogenase, beta subunit C-terminal domain [Lachnospiraceae bacterium]|nr:Coenzyme F420 hydrogenase/dehydrogenase, beta subunit C-terminal domain [Lachnospiraceae bacterium]
MNRKEKKGGQLIKAWKYSSVDSNIKMKSSSGGAFYDIAYSFIKDGGYICGCVWNENLQAQHIISNKVEDLEKMQGSKYVQSEIGNVFNEVVSKLKYGQKVLFSGTPCQVTALHRIICEIQNMELLENLITIAILCHGVASPGSWESFKKWIEEKNQARLIDVNFRDKSKEGYKKTYCRYEFDSGKVLYTPTYLPTSKYVEATLVYNLAIRDSCTHCDCKGINGACDIVLGDWNEDYRGDGALGTSCIVAFTEKGKTKIEKVLCKIKSIDYDEIVSKNCMIQESTKRNPLKDEFLNRMWDIAFWNKVEILYPPKYKLKKVLVKLGLYDVLRKMYLVGKNREDKSIKNKCMHL